MESKRWESGNRLWYGLSCILKDAEVHWIIPWELVLINAQNWIYEKHYGDTIVKYHEIPILDVRNINDQGIDANGVVVVPGKWYAYDANGVRIGEYNTSHEAKAAAGATGSIISGDGNMFGGSKDLLVQNGSFPLLTEEGGIVNRVGMKRLVIEAKVAEFGFFMSFTKRSLEMDTEKGLLARYSRNVGETQCDIREAQIRNSLIGAS